MSDLPFNRLFNIHACRQLIESKRSLKADYTKVAIVGSRSYENKNKIRDMIFTLKNKLPNLEIVSGGAANGADRYAKKFALELGVGYAEFNPAHTNRNLHSAMSDSYYSKPYHVSQFHHRNLLIARDCDVMIALIPKGVDAKGSESAINAAKRLNKKVVVLT